MQRIVGTGLIALDVLVDKNNKVQSSSLGGSAGNVMSILSALGWESTPVATLGNDSAGQRLLDEFDDLGVDLRLIKKSSNYHTPVVYQHQLSCPSGATHRFSFECPYCGHKTSPSTSIDNELVTTALDSVPQTNVFFFDRPSEESCRLAEVYASNGAFVIFEPSSPGKDLSLFVRALSVSHIVKYANDRFDDLTRFNADSKFIEIKTLGAHGLKFRVAPSSKDWTTLGAYNLPQIKDTSGAGDWCTAGLIYSLFGGMGERSFNITCDRLISALTFGQVLSSLNCMTWGARGLLKAIPAEEIKEIAKSFSKYRLQKNESTSLDQHLSGEGLVEVITKGRKDQYYYASDISSSLCCEKPDRSIKYSLCK